MHQPAVLTWPGLNSHSMIISPARSTPLEAHASMRRTFGVLLLAALLPVFALGLVTDLAHAQSRPRDIMNAAEIQAALAKARVVGTVLYVAAHPDDENTALLAYLARERKVRTGYLSATRGDGGQNLLGTETGSLLGMIRTQELLAARRIDGAEQFFTRALDFGFSKGPGETIGIWGHDSVLADMVWVIRTFRPDVVLTRFPTTGEGGHGHHTASAILAEEAFGAAGDPARFPEQLRFTRPWKARRMYLNSWKSDTPDPREARFISLDVGSYNPLLGRSYSEIAAESRSQHKSQGFGSAERRGKLPAYFYPLAGDTAGVRDILQGIDLGWNRLPGGETVDRWLAEAQKGFDPARPEAIVSLLLRAHAALRRLPPDAMVDLKEREILELIRSCSGLWLEALATVSEAPPGEKLKFNITALNRSGVPFRLEKLETQGFAESLALGTGSDAVGAPLAFNQPAVVTATIRVPKEAPASQPYWLRGPSGKGLFQVEDPRLVGRPENPAAISIRVTLSAEGETLDFDLPVAFRWTDPVAGTRYRPFEVVPRATLRLDRGMYVFPDAGPREVLVVARDGGMGIWGRLSLSLPTGWRAEPAFVDVTLSAKNPEQEGRFKVYPTPAPASGNLGAMLVSGGDTLRNARVVVEYPHIPTQVLFPPAASRFARLDIKIAGRAVGYLMGSGDQVPEALTQLGYQVTLLSDAEVENSDLSRFDAIIAGVRAYNTRPRLRALQGRLLDFARKGGALVLQYNTLDAGLDDRLGPYPFKISSERVTVEETTVRFDSSAHPLLNRPNKIEAADMEGWVQERGLNFANPYDPRYETPLSCHDPDEPDRKGGLLFARHGQGVFIYTGYSWFRELPAGVPGALKLFANLVSAGRAGH